MKKDLQKLIAFLAVMFVSFAITAQEYGRILNESFENGIPTEWTQEKISGAIDWTVESGVLTRPSDAFDGAKRVVFRNATGVTSNAKTRLISPQFDAVSLYQPILIFAHAQDKWTDDFDTLKVFYRTAPEKDWVQLKVFDKCISKWQLDTLRLIGATKTYQIAFEATDNLGRGVVLDDIEVRSTPNCIAPYNLNIANISNDSVSLGWLGAFDALSFDIKVDTIALTPEQLADPNYKAQICDVNVKNVWEYTVKGLQAGTKYYYYIRSNCEQESSEWTASTFSTSNFLTLPYYETFNNVEKTTGSNVSYPENWMLYGTDRKPYINSNYNGQVGQNFSVDTSFVLCFGGSNSSDCGTALTAGHYAYAVLPQINIDNINDLQISFWSISYWPTRIDRSSIVVGIMSDPENKSSFVPVDTVLNTSLREHKQHFVSFENYKGEGKYIALMSDFSDRNLFVVENLSVSYRPEVMKVNFGIGIPSATSLKLNFEQIYDKYEVMITSEQIDVNEIDASKVILTTEISNLGEIKNIPSETFVFVYARGIKGDVKGEWSNFKRIRMPAQVQAFPYMVDFEIDEDDEETFYFPYFGSSIFSSSTMLPNNVTYLSDHYNEVPEVYDMYWEPSNPGSNLVQRSNYELNMTGYLEHRNAYCAAVFPELTDLKNTRVGFYTCKHSASPTAISEFYVGIMSDANDISTFEYLDTIRAEQRYSYHIYDFDEYQGNGKFFAVMVNHMDRPFIDEVGENHYIYVYLDDVSFTKIPTCKNPYEVNVEYNEADPTKVKLTWDASGATAWNLKVAGEEYVYDSVIVSSNLQYTYNQNVTTNSVELTGLDYPGKQYFYWIQAIQPGVDTAEWSKAEYFTTQNYAEYPLPFIEDFDKDWYSTATNKPGFAAKSLQTQQIAYSSSYYPYLSTLQKASGTKSMVFYKSSSWLPKGANIYVALPKMVDDVNKLQLSFKMMVSKTEQVISVGVMSNPLDSTTQVEVAKVKPKLATEWVEYIVTFDSYKGDGEYIYIATDDLYPSIYSAYIDDIKVEYINSCRRPEDVKLSDVSNSFAQFSWTSPSKKARILISKERLTIEDLESPVVGGNIIAIDTVATNPAIVDGLEDNSAYYAYVQSMCDDNELSAWSNPLPFRTTCVVLNTYELGIEDFDSYGTGNGKYPTCYIVGNKTSDATAAFIPSCVATWKHSGGASLKLQSSTTYNGAYAITSRLDISDISMLRVKLWASAHTYTKSEHAHSLVVGVVTDPTDLATFVPVDTLNLAKEGRPFEVYLDKYKYDMNGDKGKYVMFLSEFDKTNYAFIDDVQFDTIPSCLARFDVENVTSNSISLSFNGNNAPYQFKYATELCDTSILNGDNLPVEIVQNNTLEINNLDYNTNYYLYARPTCDGEYGEWSNVVVVRTSCINNFELPFFEDFEKNENTGSKNNPDCWYSFFTETDNSYPDLSSTAYSGERSVRIYTNKKGVNPYLVSQEIVVDKLSKCQVSFFARPTTSKKDLSLIIGAVGSLDSIAESFVALDTISVNVATVAWEKYLISLENCPDSLKYLAFTTDYELNSNSSNGFYLDDITIELIPTCAKPDYFEFVGHTDKSLTLSFVHAGALKYEVKYGAKDFNVDSEGILFDNVNDTIFTLIGLNAETEYDIYVRAICSESETSPWSFAGTYETTAEPISTFPYQFNFEDDTETAKWRFVQNEQPNQWVIGIDTANIVADKLNNTDKALYISKDGGLTANYREKADENNVAATSYSWAYRTVYLEPGVYTISYDWTCYGEATSDYMRVGLVPASSKFEAGSNKIIANDATSVNFTYTVATQPKGWYELSQQVDSYFRLNGTDTTKTLSEQWATEETTIVVTKEQAGSYNLLFYWKNDNSNSASRGYYSERGAAIDNVSILKSACDMPINFEVGKWDNSSVNLKWSDILDAPTSYNLLFAYEDVDPNVATEDQIDMVKQVTSNDIKIEGLKGGITYYVYVQSACSETSKSLWTGPVSFTTLCDPQEVNVVNNFDDENQHYYPLYTNNGTESKYPGQNCFVISHESLEYTSSDASYFPYVIKNTASKQYSRSGDYAIYFNRTNGTTQPGSIIAMPAVVGDLKEMQLSFWMRAVDHSLSANTLGNVSRTNIGTTYAHKITVGTMTDPNDPSTFVVLDTIDYPYTQSDIATSTKIGDDPTGNNYWVEVNLPLANATGKYVAFRNEHYGKNYNKLYIDDVVISAASCIAPSALEFSSITSTSAIVNAIHGESLQYVINIATDVDFTQNMRQDTVQSLPAKIEGLTPTTNYYVNIVALCEDNQTSNVSITANFVTASTICYDEEFATSNYCPYDWSRAYDITFEDRVTNQTEFKMYDVTALGSSWRTHSALFESGLFSSRHMFASISASVDEGWLFSPFIELTNKEKQHLVFDLALTESGTVTPIPDEVKVNKDDRFIVVISDDFGATWKRENATIWGHSGTDDYQFFDISHRGERVSIDLAKYVGKVIQVAFYVESEAKDGAKLQIHLDNVHINTYAENNITDAICQTEDYEDEIFFISSTNLAIGENKTNELRLSSISGVDDVYYSLTVNVTPMVTTNLYDAICEGDVYAKYNFAGLMKPGVYKQKLQAANGCDSVVILDLSVTAAEHTMIFDTICYGNSVSWNGKEYNRTGTYTDTLVSNVTGCDSIVSFVLKVNDAIRSEQYVNICFGDTYTFGTQVISKSGPYEEKFVTASGCDSIVTLHATVLPDYRKTINAVIKEGQSYNENGFVGLTHQDTYRLPLTSVDGCDSTITLNLTVLSADTTYVTSEITTNDLPFEYETLYYDENTQPGTYVDTLVIVNEDDSKYVIIHTLIVHLYNAVNNINVNDLMLLPNPVNVNSTLFVHADFTSEEREGLLVEVFNSIGQRVYIDTPAIYPIQIGGLAERGIYMVRITAGTGKSYQGKVVVK